MKFLIVMIGIQYVMKLIEKYVEKEESFPREEQRGAFLNCTVDIVEVDKFLKFIKYLKAIRRLDK